MYETKFVLCAERKGLYCSIGSGNFLRKSTEVGKKLHNSGGWLWTRVPSRTQEHRRSSSTLSSLRGMRLGQQAPGLASNLHGLDHQARCWSAWACQNWPPASSKCLQKPASRGGCKPSGALGSQHCQPPSTWSCDTHTWRGRGDG